MTTLNIAKALIPLTDAQRRLWYMAQLEPGSVYYNVTIATRLDGPLNVEALTAALQGLVERHTILRTTYPQIDGEPFQYVNCASGFRVRTTHRPCDEGTRAAAIQSFADEIARRSIKLAEGPLFEAHLLSLSGECHALVLLTHHIAIDQHSINTLMAELDQSYAARAAGGTPLLGPVQSYSDFAEWHHGEIERRLPLLQSYWGAHLADLPSPLNLPPASRTDGERGGLGAELRFQLQSIDVEALRSHCRATRSTPFMVLLTAFSALLHRYTGQQRFFVGTTTAFRGAQRFAGTIGCFINTLAIPIEIKPDADLASVQSDIRKSSIEAFTRYDYSYERLVQQCREQHPRSSADFVNVYFQFQPPRLAGTAKRHRFVPNINVHNGRAKFPLMLNATDRGETIDCTLEFEIDRFGQTEIAALRDDFVAALRLTCGTAAQLSAITHQLDTSGWCPGAVKVTEPSINREGPLDATEAALAIIWHDLLDALPETRDASFDGLGGHSLLKAQLAWRIRRDLGVSIRLADLQGAHTLAEMAALVAVSTGERQHPIAQPANSFESIGGLSCQVEMGVWRQEAVEELIAVRQDETMPARVARIAWAFAGTPFQFESRRPLPPAGRLPIRLGAFDCYTFVITVLALASARSMVEFVHQLACLRYRDPAAIDSHPESGTIFDFAEEALVLNATGRGLLRDVTDEIFGAGRDVTIVLAPARRSVLVDPNELWVTPKLGERPITMRLIDKCDFNCFDRAGALRAGDVLLMSRNKPGANHIVDHVGFVDLDGDLPHLLQCTRYFALHDRPQPPGGGAHSGIFYDAERKFEQIGVGVAGEYAGDTHSFALMGTPIFGYVAGSRRSLRSYLDGAFSSVAVLRPVAPEGW